MDYSFYDVNGETERLAPRKAMQFGRALDRILHVVQHADESLGPVYMLKLDVSDGFYRVPLRAADIPGLGIALPSAPGEPRLIAFPLTLPMGWTESPPTFCTTTETVVDLANTYMGHWDPPVYPLETVADTRPVPPDNRTILYVELAPEPDLIPSRVEEFPTLLTLSFGPMMIWMAIGVNLSP